MEITSSLVSMEKLKDRNVELNAHIRIYVKK